MSYEADEPCAATGVMGVGIITYHHLYTRKSRPDLAEVGWNKIPVCRAAHNEFHNKGTSHMAKKYPSVKKWLETNNWQYDNFLNKWIRYEK